MGKRSRGREHRQHRYLPPHSEGLIQVVPLAILGVEPGELPCVLPAALSPRCAPPEHRVCVGRPPSDPLNPPLAGEVP